jgi:CheY-like chemotaxis protein
MAAQDKAARARARILLADDDELFRATLREELVEQGYEVIETSNGAEALEELARAADARGAVPDVLVLDVCMPGLSGLGVLDIMRRFPQQPPTLLITGFADKSIDVFASRFGAYRVLRKPVDLDEVLAAVVDAAQRKPA